MKTLRSPKSVARFCAAARARGRVVLVPTMGALHAGHLSLVRRARRLAGPRGLVVLSLFVNPIQFRPGEDFGRYPRPLRRDLALCRAAGVDLVFRPEVGGLYGANHSVYVEETALSGGLCGASRPGHFRGVCTVVAKLFHVCSPQVAVFGEKDYQQLAVIRRMVRDLNFGVRIVGAPTLREADGLAMSSRNCYLSAEERGAAPAMHRALRAGAELWGAGGSAAAARKRALAILAREPLAKLDYLEIVDAESLVSPVHKGRPARLIAAVFFGRTRLIDNLAMGVSGHASCESGEGRGRWGGSGRASRSGNVVQSEQGA